jgi:hypothetical protein
VFVFNCFAYATLCRRLPPKFIDPVLLLISIVGACVGALSDQCLLSHDESASTHLIKQNDFCRRQLRMPIYGSATKKRHIKSQAGVKTAVPPKICSNAKNVKLYPIAVKVSDTCSAFCCMLPLIT